MEYACYIYAYSDKTHKHDNISIYTVSLKVKLGDELLIVSPSALNGISADFLVDQNLWGWVDITTTWHNTIQAYISTYKSFENLDIFKLNSKKYKYICTDQ